MSRPTTSLSASDTQRSEPSALATWSSRTERSHHFVSAEANTSSGRDADVRNVAHAEKRLLTFARPTPAPAALVEHSAVISGPTPKRMISGVKGRAGSRGAVGRRSNCCIGGRNQQEEDRTAQRRRASSPGAGKPPACPLCGRSMLSLARRDRALWRLTKALGNSPQRKRGRSSVKTQPSPGRLRMRSSPPLATAPRRQIESPRPRPLRSFEC